MASFPGRALVHFSAGVKSGYRICSMTLCPVQFQPLARRIVGHSSSPEQARLLDLPLPDYDEDLAAQLVTYWDMQVKQGGEVVGYEARYRDILRRYGEASVVGRANRLARPRIRRILAAVERLLTGAGEAGDGKG